MKVFGLGLEIITTKTYMADGKKHAKILAQAIMEADEKLRAVEADRDSANKQIERLLHNGIELPLLWGAIRQVGHEKQTRQVYDRLMGGKG